MTEEKNIKLNRLKDGIEYAFKQVYENDRILIENDVCERAIMFRFAYYLLSEFQDYDVDCEYNRHITDPKMISVCDEKYCKTYPDVIIHKRGTDEKNYAVIELKKSNNKEIENDYKKLSAYTHNSLPQSENDRKLYNYNYDFGVSIIVYKNLSDTIKSCQFFIDGENVDI